MSKSFIGIASATAAICFLSIYSFIKKLKEKKDYDTDSIENEVKLIMNLIAKRRSIFPKDYDQQRKVPRKIIEDMLECANWAPNHGKTQPWRFIVYSDEALVELGNIDADLYKKLIPKDEFKQLKYEKKRQNKLLASYVIAICLHRQLSEKIPELEEIEAVACAVQNMSLCATAYGVGTVWISGKVIYSEEMKSHLGLQGQKDRCLGFLYVGYSKKHHPLGYRDSIEEKTTWVSK